MFWFLFVQLGFTAYPQDYVGIDNARALGQIRYSRNLDFRMHHIMQLVGIDIIYVVMISSIGISCGIPISP